MKKSAWAVLFVILLAFLGCSKREEPVPLAEKRFHQANEPQPRRGVAQAADAALWVTEVALSPETPVRGDDITASARLSDPDAVGVALEYEWYVNGQEQADSWEERLSGEKTKKGDWIYCRARALQEGDAGPWTKSELVKVLNTPPELRLGPVGEIAVPGEFRYQADAGDADSDELAYELLAPKDKGIVLDAKSGLLTWALSAETVRGLGEKAEIRIAVSDGEARAEGTIALSFSGATKQAELP